MVMSKLRFLTRLLFCAAAVICAHHAAPLRAENICFQFQTTIDARPAGGSESTPLIVTYAFDSKLQDGTGPFGLGSYGPIVMMIQVGDQIVTASGVGTGITVVDDSLDGSDSYDIRVENDSGLSVNGTLFGMEIILCRFVIVDIDGTMFNSTALPLSPAFATQADFQQTELDLIDPVSGNLVTLMIEESADTPPADLTPFSLTQLSDSDAVVTIDDVAAEVVALNLPLEIEDSLLGDLSSALQALAGGGKNSAKTAANNIQSFINAVNAQTGKAITDDEAVALIAQATFVLLVLGP